MRPSRIGPILRAVNMQAKILSVIFFLFLWLFFSRTMKESRELPPKKTIPPALCKVKKPQVERGNRLLKQPVTQDELRNISETAVHFLTYGDHRFADSLRRIEEEARSLEIFSSFSVYTPENLSSHVQTFFATILKRPRGGGYWIWKPFVVREALERAKFGDFVFYADAGCTLRKEGIKRFQKYLLMLSRSRSGILSIAEEHLERKYTSGRILETFGVRENKLFLDSPHYWAGMLLMQKRRKTVQLLDTVIRLMHVDKWLFTDEYGRYREVKGFDGNRHDQSVLSVMRKCWGSVVVHDRVNENVPHLPVWSTRIRG